MIIDKIENARLYKAIHPTIGKALEYIENAHFSDLPMGRSDIDGDKLYVILKDYQTKPIETENLLESHRAYIDLQYIIEGVEQMGITMQNGQVPNKQYDAKDDYMLFEETYDLITIRKGMFAIFFPDDLHMPDMTTDQPTYVKKAVFKVKI